MIYSLIFPLMFLNFFYTNSLMKNLQNSFRKEHFLHTFSIVKKLLNYGNHSILNIINTL